MRRHRLGLCSLSERTEDLHIHESDLNFELDSMVMDCYAECLTVGLLCRVPHCWPAMPSASLLACYAASVGHIGRADDWCMYSCNAEEDQRAWRGMLPVTPML